MKIGNRPVAIAVVIVIFGALSSALVAAAFGDFGQWEEKQARHLPGAIDPDRSPIETTQAFLSYMVELMKYDVFTKSTPCTKFIGIVNGPAKCHVAPSHRGPKTDQCRHEP